jgi:hypothetical protein
MNIISASFGLVANAPWNPSYSSLIYNLNKAVELIILNIPLVNKLKLAYTYIDENNSLPEQRLS